MRILSSPKVVKSAEFVARRIIDTYLEPKDLSGIAGDGEPRVNRSPA
jgi:hypothetical protein